MKQKTAITTAVLAAALLGALLGLGMTRLTPAAKAAPAATTADSAMATALAGTAYPATLRADQIDSTYHLVDLVDAQGKAATYATKGELVAAGSETFLVTYYVALTSGTTRPPQPKADATAQLTLINLRSVQAVGAIIPISPPDAK